MTDVTIDEHQEMLIDGLDVVAIGGQTFETIDPATARTLCDVPRGGKADVDAAVDSARRAQPGWIARLPVDRARILSDVALGIRTNGDYLARLETLDTGKPLRQGQADVQVAARYFEFYASLADKLFGTTIPLGTGYVDYTTREPFGVSAQIVPWNYPLQIGARGIAPALAGGNSVVIKPAREAPLSLLALARIAIDAGLPAGLLNVVTGTGEEAGAMLAGHPGIDQLTFTGSVAVGTQVMRAAAANIVPVTLELGGKCPNVVFEDADLDEALPMVLNAIIQNAGQTCSAATRLIVAASIHDTVVERLASKMDSVRIGRGLDDPDMGPLISRIQRDRVATMVDDATRAGAVVAAGGCIPSAATEHGGYYYAPTLVDSVLPDMAIAREELFGPVLAVMTFSDDEEAVSLANATDFGLVCGVWTRDISRAHRAARDIRAGQVYVNCYGAAGGAELPFGGMRKSGFGREKGAEGMNSYLQTKNVCVKL